ARTEGSANSVAFAAPRRQRAFRGERARDAVERLGAGVCGIEFRVQCDPAVVGAKHVGETQRARDAPRVQPSGDAAVDAPRLETASRWRKLGCEPGADRRYNAGVDHAPFYPLPLPADVSAAVLALFDLDHTLVPHDSDEEWVAFLIDQEVLDRTQW